MVVVKYNLIYYNSSFSTFIDYLLSFFLFNLKIKFISDFLTATFDIILGGSPSSFICNLGDSLLRRAWTCTTFWTLVF